MQKADNTLIMYTGKYSNVIFHFLLHIYWENKNKKDTINPKWGPNVRKKGRQLSKTVTVLTAILTGTHFWELVLQDWKPSHQSEKTVCVLLPYTPYWKRNKIASIPHKEADWNAILFLWDTRYINHLSCILPSTSFRIKWKYTLIHKRDTWK